MLSRKDLSSAELETLQRSRNPTTVSTANGEVQTNEEAHDLELFVTVHILEDTPAVLSLRKLCEHHGYLCEWASGQKPHLTTNGRTNPMQHGEPCTDRCPRIVGMFFQLECKYVSYIVTQDTSDDSSSSPATTRRDSTRIPVMGNQLRDPTETKNTNKNRDIVLALGKTVARFARVVRGVHRKSRRRRSVSIKGHPNTSHDSDSGRPTKEVSRKHSIFTHVPKDRNCEVCKRTKITRALCRKHTGDAVPRPENFGDLSTAYHKVLSEDCESRNSHGHAIVVQDLPIQRIQSYPCKTKTSQETRKSLVKFLEPTRKPKVIYTDNSLEFGKSCEHQRPIDPRQMVLLKEQCAERKQGHLRYCCNQVRTKNGGRILWNVSAICEMFKTSWHMGRHHMKGGSGCLLKDQW